MLDLDMVLIHENTLSNDIYKFFPFIMCFVDLQKYASKNLPLGVTDVSKLFDIVNFILLRKMMKLSFKKM